MKAYNTVKNKITNLLNNDSKIVEKRKILFLVPAGILAVALLCGIIYSFVFGSAFKLGMDFEGGYTMNIRFERKLDASTYDDYCNEIRDFVENYKDYNIVISKFRNLSVEERTTIEFHYKAVAGTERMKDINEDLSDALAEKFLAGSKYEGEVSPGRTIDPSVSSEYILSAVLSVIIASILIMIYVAFRFEVISGVTAIIGLLHDVAIMTAFMLIFQIEINSTYIAALITIVGYSINSTIILFDRIRENLKAYASKNPTGSFIANRSVRETLLRSFNTSFTTLIMIGMVAIFGVPDIKIFALPIIVGLLAGAYSSIFIVPAIWSAVVDKHPDWVHISVRQILRDSFAKRKATAAKKTAKAKK